MLKQAAKKAKTAEAMEKVFLLNRQNIVFQNGPTNRCGKKKKTNIYSNLR